PPPLYTPPLHDALPILTTTHAYAVAGTYTVTLTVTDNSGNTGTSSATVTVSTQQPGAHVSFFQWSVRPQYKKFSISKQGPIEAIDRKSTRLNSSHQIIS